MISASCAYDLGELHHGMQDRLIPVSNSRRLAAAFPSATLVEFEDCGHCPQEEQPERLAATICAFLQEHGVC